MFPSVRRNLQPALGLVFASAAFVGAVIPALLTRLGLRPLHISPALLALSGLGAAVFDLGMLRFGRPRPLATNRQVPRDWGHRYGPWWAALRYGLRMGFGPATILSTWFWWPAFAAAASRSTTLALLGSAVFAVVRTLTMFAAVTGITDGRAMAKRSAQLGQWQARGRTSVIVIGMFASLGLLFAAR